MLNNLAGRSPVVDAIVVFLAAYLQYVLVVAFFLLLYFSAYSRREKWRIFWTAAVSAAVARLGITEIIRFFYHRPRPFVINPAAHTLLSENDWSFPSGHSAFFFAVAAALYCYNKKWGIVFFIAAIVMNISRVVAGVHYPSDILGGMVVGTIVGGVVFYFIEKRKSKKAVRHEQVSSTTPV